MKVLTLDIETSPNVAYVWRLFKENVPLARLMETGEILCFSAKWLGNDEVLFYSKRNKDLMLEKMHGLLSEADVIITYNGKKFDVPYINKELLVAEFTPPSPYAHVDLYQIVRSKFNFTSNKLEHVVKELGLAHKMDTGGFDLWTGCMANDDASWATMEQYNKTDVRITEDLYQYLLPWITNHPNVNLYSGLDNACPGCGSDDVQKRGYAYTNMTAYQQYWCKDCGKWFRGNKKVESSSVTNVR